MLYFPVQIKPGNKEHNMFRHGIVIIRFIMTLSLYLQCLPLALAAEKTLETLPGGQIIVFEQAVKMIKGDNIYLLDVRNPVNYGRGHITGAEFISYDSKSRNIVDFDASQDSFDLNSLPENKRTSLIFYSHGITGWKSYKAAVQAVRAGHEMVYWYRGGFSDWENRGGQTAH